MPKTILVVAPRRERYDELDPGGRIVLTHRARLHPANPAYNFPAGEICICEGQGVKGDPGGQHEPWEVYPYPEVAGLLGTGRLVQVTKRSDDTSDLVITEDQLESLNLTGAQIKALQREGVSNVAELVSRLDRSDSMSRWLTSIRGVGQATANTVLDELANRDLVPVREF